MAWNDLTLSDKARMIQLAVNSGITDLRTIQEVYNKYATGGQKEDKSNTNKLGRIPIIGKLAKDAAYKIITEPEVWYSAGATPKSVVKALTSDSVEDDNKRMFIYGVDRKETSDENAYGWKKDIDENNYGKVKSYEGTLNPYNQYVVNSRDRGLIEELAKAKYSAVLNINDEYSDPETGFIAKETPYFDDVHGYRIVFHTDSSGNPVISASDLYDFGKNYSKGFGKLYEERSGAKDGQKKLELQRRLLNSVGTPYKLVQKNIPIHFTDNPQGSEVYRANSFTQQVLDNLSTEDIARITGAGTVAPSVVVGNRYAAGGQEDKKKNYYTAKWKDLPKSYQKGIIQKAKEMNIPESEVPEWYESGRLNAALGPNGYPNNGRVRENDSPTKEASETLENNMNRMVYDGAGSRRPNMKYSIPYLEDKEIKVKGVGRVTTNALDSLAKYAAIVGVPLEEALGLSAQETAFGAAPYYNYDSKINGETISSRALGNSSYFRNFGVIPAENFVRDFRYNKPDWKGVYISQDVPPLQHALEYWKAGKYNPGDPNHTKDVRSKGQKLMTDPNIRQWMNSSPYVKKKK